MVFNRGIDIEIDKDVGVGVIYVCVFPSSLH